MRRKAEGGLEGAGQAKTIHPGDNRQLVQAHVLVEVRMEIVPRLDRCGRQTRGRLESPPPAHPAGQGFQQRIERGVPDDAHLTVIKRLQRVGNAKRQIRLAGEGLGEGGQAVLGNFIAEAL